MKGKPKSTSQKRTHAARMQRARIKRLVKAGEELPMMSKMHPKTRSYLKSQGIDPNRYAVGEDAYKIEPMKCFGIKDICSPAIRKEIDRIIHAGGDWEQVLRDNELWDTHCRLVGLKRERNRECYRKSREALGEVYTPRVGAAVQNLDDKWDHIVLPPMRPMTAEEIAAMTEVNKCKKVDE